MRPDLLDAKAAIDWAVAQVPVLQDRVNAWVKDVPYSVRIDADSEPGKKHYRLTGLKALDPIVSAEAGAIIHSIRSSLDLLACALAERNGYPNSTSTYFPVAKDIADFRDPKSKLMEKIKRLKQVHKDIIIKDLKPYPGGNDLLCALHNLDLTRKHRRLLDTAILPRGMGFSGLAYNAVTVHPRSWDTFQEEAILISTPASLPDGDVTLGLNVIFNEPGPMQANFVGTIRQFAKLAYDALVLFCPAGT